MQIMLFRKPYLFHFRLGFLLLSAVLTILCCYLGAWQLHRYHFKKQLLKTFEIRLRADAVPISAIDKNDPQFQKVKLHGQFVTSKDVMIQNQFYQGQVGFEVLTPVKIANSKKLLLVDRGWIPNKKADIAIASAKIPPKNIEIQGYIKLIDHYQFTLGENILDPASSPLVIQKINFKELSKILQIDLYPYILRLEPNMPNGFVRDWVISSVVPERHMAYVLQWFALALVLVISSIIFSFEKVK